MTSVLMIFKFLWLTMKHANSTQLAQVSQQIKMLIDFLKSVNLNRTDKSSLIWTPQQECTQNDSKYCSTYTGSLVIRSQVMP